MSPRMNCHLRHAPLFACVVCLFGAPRSLVRADELRPPWQAGPCTLWTRLPPAMRYLAPLETDEGLWAAAADGAVLMRLQADFLRSQMQTFSEQARELGDAFTQTASDAGRRK